MQDPFQGQVDRKTVPSMLHHEMSRRPHIEHSGLSPIGSINGDSQSQLCPVGPDRLFDKLLYTSEYLREA